MRLALAGIHKSFAGTHAIQDVALDVHPASIHALLGENGAGKSTLMKIVAGALRPDSGSMTLDGARYTPDDPLAARQCGVSIVYQELSVCPDLSVAENVLLGAEPRRFGWISARESERRVRAALEPMLRQSRGLPLDVPVR